MSFIYFEFVVSIVYKNVICMNLENKSMKFNCMCVHATVLQLLYVFITYATLTLLVLARLTNRNYQYAFAEYT